MNQLQSVITWIERNAPKKIAVLTGAGFSAESGIPTFRGAGSLWESFRAEDLATPEAFRRDPALVWRWYQWRRDLVENAEPNAAHRSLVSLEKQIASRGRLTVITQNVDGLHRRAGTERLIEVHGSILRSRCVRDGEISLARFSEVPPHCGCGALLRPDIVWFGEALPMQLVADAEAAVAEADLLLIVGTSGTVYPAAGFITFLRRGTSIEINPEPTPLTRVCDFAIESSAVTAVPLIADAVIRSLR